MLSFIGLHSSQHEILIFIAMTDRQLHAWILNCLVRLEPHFFLKTSCNYALLRFVDLAKAIASHASGIQTFFASAKLCTEPSAIGWRVPENCIMVSHALSTWHSAFVANAEWQHATAVQTYMYFLPSGPKLMNLVILAQMEGNIFSSSKPA